MTIERLSAEELLHQLIRLQQNIVDLERQMSSAPPAASKAQEHETQLNRLLEESFYPVVVISDEVIAFANPRFTRLMGYRPEEILGIHITRLVEPRALPDALQRYEALVAGQPAPPTAETTLITKEGSALRVLMYAGRVEYQGSPSAFVVFHDVTFIREAEKELFALRQYQNSLIDAVNIWVDVLDKNMNVIVWNLAAEEISGYPREEVLGSDRIWELLYPDQQYRNQIQMEAESILVGSSEVKDFETTITRKDGGRRVISWFSRAILDQRGSPIGSIAIGIDVTARKEAVELLLEASKKYQGLADSISDVFFAMDKNLRYTYWNKASENLTGIPAEKTLGKTLMEVFPDNEARQKVKEMYLQVMEANQPQNLIVNYPGGGGIVHEISAYPSVEGISVFVKDITERIKAEEKLQYTLESLRKAFNTIIRVMISAVEIRDPYTAGHQTRSSNLARSIATEMELSQDKIEGLRMAGSIHDIGKLSIPAEILSKPTKLSELEFSMIKEHAQNGYEILKKVESPWPLAEIVYQHHERMDGSGYPRNLKGDDILMEARILAVADVVESMASHRPYRPAQGFELALGEIEKNKGILYDPEVVDACLRLFREKGFRFA